MRWTSSAAKPRARDRVNNSVIADAPSAPATATSEFTGRHRRQPDDEFRSSAPALAEGRDVSSMLLDDAPHHGEPDPEPGHIPLASREQVEDVWQLLGDRSRGPNLLTRMRTASASVINWTSTVPPCGVYLTAFPIRLSRTCWMRCWSAWIRTGCRQGQADSVTFTKTGVRRLDSSVNTLNEIEGGALKRGLAPHDASRVNQLVDQP